MSTLFGLLGLSDRDTTVDQVGQRVVYEAINQFATAQERETLRVASLFSQGDITEYKEVIKLPGGGRMQEQDRLGNAGAVKRTGGYDVAYDLRQANDALGWDEVSRAYMTITEVDSHLKTVMTRHTNWVMFHILKHLLNASNETFKDELRGDLTIRRLANADGTLYPPLVGADSELSGHSHYLVSGYAASSISDSNNPFPVIRDHLEEHFNQGNVIVFINNAQRAKVEALTDFDEIDDPDVKPAITRDQVIGSPGVVVPGRLLGKIDWLWVYEWRRLPAGYMLAIDVDQTAPLKRRIDEDRAASLRGFKLVAERDDYPLQKSEWRDRHGWGVANRLSALVMELTTNGSYSTPAAYA